MHHTQPTVTNRARFRKRPDLVSVPQWFSGRRCWAIKDPVSLSYYHLSSEEFAIFEMLDGRTGLEEIRRRFEKTFAPLRITTQRLHAFLNRLHRAGLVNSEMPRQGEQLLKRDTRRQYTDAASVLLSPLAIRFRGVNPTALLDWLYPKIRWVFAPWSVAACVMLVIAAGTMAAVHADQLASTLPGLGELLTGRHAFWLLATMAVCKIFHELGHALACKHFGGRCHELGLMLLVGTPCLYCNVSDAWMMPNKWRRIAISAAGMGVELVLAAVCTLVWFSSEPGLVRTLCLNAMLVCSISTLLFNGNPLLRYDGYYILADLVEVPNLAERSRSALSKTLARWMLGIEIFDDAIHTTRRGWLLLYALASAAYRWFVVIMVLWFVNQTLAAHKLAVVGHLIALVAVVGMVAMPVHSAARFLGNPLRRQSFRRGRAALSASLVAAVCGAVLLFPLPFHVRAPVVLEPHDARRVYVKSPGTLVWAAGVGSRLRKGEPIARLEDLDIEREIASLSGQRDQARLRIESLAARRASDPGLAQEIPTARAILEDIEEQLRQRRLQASELVIAAPVDGVVLPPPALEDRPAAPGELHGWQNTPLDPINRRSYLETGTLVCLIGQPDRLQAVLTVDQFDIEFVKPGRSAVLRLAQLPGDTVSGRVVEIAMIDLDAAADRRKAQGSRFERSHETLYQARVTIDPHEQSLLIGAAGHAKIFVEPQSLAERLSRTLKQTFGF